MLPETNITIIIVIFLISSFQREFARFRFSYRQSYNKYIHTCASLFRDFLRKYYLYICQYFGATNNSNKNINIPLNRQMAQSIKSIQKKIILYMLL